jgi:glutamyl-Q tRNA(Asp) synthetase
MTFRFAPSPTGPLHLGHAYSAILAYDRAIAAKKPFLLRIEDIDQSRARSHWEQKIYDDLEWLGIAWSRPVMRQSDRKPAYDAALDQLSDLGLIYPCNCRRGDIEAAASAPQEGVPQFGPDGRIYPGTCRNRSMSTRTANDVIRLDVDKAAKIVDHLSFWENGPVHQGHFTIKTSDLKRSVGDVILVRRQMDSSYHLSVVVDDAAQHVSEVTRGHDLFEATQIHVLLQRLLHLPTPHYHHHDLIRDSAGKRLAKRDDARAIGAYRAQGMTPNDLRAAVGLPHRA